MGNVCSRLCPKRRKSRQASYDVHQQTFQMQQNIDSMNIDDNSPITNNDKILSQQFSSYPRQSQEKLTGKTFQIEEDNTKQQQKKYIEKKINTTSKKQKIQVQSQFSMQDSESAKNIQGDTESLISKQQPPILNSQNLKQSEHVRAQQPEIQPSQQTQKPVNPNILKPKAIKKKYNPDDYRFKDEDNTFKVKKIDSIKCQQYNIENCNNCQYFIFDITANVYIDDTNDCKIYIAPCQSTIFVRNCKNLIIIAATKQFRTYQCHNSKFSLLCKTQPVIESSSNLTFSPFNIQFYPEFMKQMNTVKLDLWNNHWSEIHNFTKKQGEAHYALQRNIEETEVLNWDKAFNQAQLEKNNQNPVPFIQGQYPIKEENYSKLLILFNKDISKNDDFMLSAAENFRILKSFKGKLAGFGKDERVALLLGYQQGLENKQKFQQMGQLFIDQQEVEKYQNQFFPQFNDLRQ